MLTLDDKREEGGPKTPKTFLLNTWMFPKKDVRSLNIFTYFLQRKFEGTWGKRMRSNN